MASADLAGSATFELCRSVAAGVLGFAPSLRTSLGGDAGPEWLAAEHGFGNAWNSEIVDAVGAVLGVCGVVHSSLLNVRENGGVTSAQ